MDQQIGVLAWQQQLVAVSLLKQDVLRKGNVPHAYLPDHLAMPGQSRALATASNAGAWQMPWIAKRCLSQLFA